MISIPEISDQDLQSLLHIKPVIKKDSKLYYVQNCDPREQAFSWGRPTKRASGLKEKSRHRTLHSFGYHAFFKPSAAEVFAQVPREELKDVIAFQTIGPDTASDLNKNVEELNAGFHVAETILYTRGEENTINKPLGYQEFFALDIEERLDCTTYLVQATSEEKHSFWERFHDNPNPKFIKEAPIKTWEQGSGNYLTVGYFGEHPVCISLMWDKLDGHWVCFWEATSRVIDYQIIDEWFRLNYTRRTHDNRPAKTNAANFFHTLSEIKELNKKN